MFKAITQITSLVLLASVGSAHASTPNPYQELSQKSYPYDLLYPLYAIECGVTQYNKIKDSGGVKADKGGSFGHSVVYLKNVCRDTSVDYPKIRKCAPGEKDLSSPEGGMTLSLDKNFSNTRYIPTDGLDMMLNGVSEDNQPLTTAQEDATVQKLLASGAARGIKLTKATAEKIPAGMSDEEWALRNVVSSSFAIRFGRNSRCVSTPINEKMLDAAIDWVNNQNEPFVTGKTEYHWNMADQCTDFAHNVLASMGIVSSVRTGESIAYGIFTFSSLLWKPWHPVLQIPMNDVLSTEEHAGEAKIPTAEEVYANAKERANFEKFGRLASTDGTLLFAVEAHTFDNQLFNTHAGPTLIDVPILKTRTKKLERSLNTPSKTDLASNLNSYHARVGVALQKQKSFDQVISERPELNTAEFKAFYDSYVSYLTTLDSEIANRETTLLNATTVAVSP